MLQPHNYEQAESLIQEWLQTADVVPRLLILAGDDYDERAMQGFGTLSDKQSILWFEHQEGSTMPSARVSSFYINRYGTAYLAGAMAADFPSAIVMSAMQGNKVLAEATQGFCDGYAAHSDTTPNIVFLADDVEGFSMPGLAYALADESLNHEAQTFFYPLAGGSNQGIYKYLREHTSTNAMAAGMDVDCSQYCPRVPFSVVIHIDKAIEYYLTQWLATGTLPSYQKYMLQDGMIEVVVNNNLIDSRMPPFYWQARIHDLYDEAISQEQQHEK